MAEGRTRSAHAARLGAPCCRVWCSHVPVRTPRGAHATARGGSARATAVDGCLCGRRCRAYVSHGAICGVGCRSQGVHWMCAGTLGEPARQARDARPAAAALKVQGAAGMALLLFGANAQRRTLRTGNTGGRGCVRSHGYRTSGSRSASTAPPSSRYSSGRITAACVVGVAPYWISGSEPVTAVPADPQHCPLAATRVL